MIKIIKHNLPIYTIGDIHGRFDMLYNEIEKRPIENCILLVLGDCGFGLHHVEYYANALKSLDEFCAFRNIYCYMLRGNHDDKRYFDGNKDYQLGFTNIHLIDDYTVIQSEDKTVLCVGGAISIDRQRRIKMYNNYCRYFEELAQSHATLPLPSYWENEIPIYDEDKLNEINALGLKITHVATHTSPHFAFKKDKKGIEFFLSIDKYLEKDLDNEREVFTKIFDFLKIHSHPLCQWVYGHFHEHYNEVIENIEFTALHHIDIGADIKELTMFNHQNDVNLENYE